MATEAAAERLRFTTEVSEVAAASDLIFLCVGTPSMASGHPDITDVASAVETIGSYVKNDLVIVTKSTVPIGRLPATPATTP